MGPTSYLRIKTFDVGIPLFQSEFEVKAVEHNSLAKYCYGGHMLNMILDGFLTFATQS